MTENSAGRRLLRAVAKLRNTFAGRGITLPAAAVGSAITGVLIATTPPVAHAAIIPTAATAASRAAMRMLRWQILKPLVIAAIMTIIVGGSGLIWTIANRTPQTGAAMTAPVVPVIASAPVAIDVQDESELKAPGLPQLFQWDVLLQESAHQAIEDIGRPVQSQSNLYQARLFNAAQLRRAVADAIGSDGIAAVSHHSHLISLPQQVFDGKRENEQLAPQYSVTDPGNFIWFFSASNKRTDEFDRLGDAVRVHLDHPDMNAGIADEARRNLVRPPGGSGIVFDGQVAAGQTLAFIAPFTAQSGAMYYHLMAWEVFQASTPQVASMDFPTDAGWWCQHGPEQLRLWVDAERIWSDWTGFGRTFGAPSIERKLSNGESVWLFALCRPSEYPFCWWDPQGKPAPPWPNGVPMDGAPATGLWAQVGVSNSANIPWKPSPDDGNGEQENPGNPIECQPIDPAKPLQIGVPIGLWREMLQLHYNKPVTLDGIHYEIVPDPDNPQYWAKLTRTGALDDQLHVITIHHDGTKHRFEVQRQLKWSPQGTIGTITEGILTDCPPQAVDYFSIRLRKREFVTFNTFASEPSTKPPANLTREQTDLELTRITKQHLQKCLDQLPQQRGKYFFNWLSPKDDSWNGGMVALLGAAIGHDERTVRKTLSATTKPASDVLDSLAHLMVRGEAIGTAVSNRLGEPAAHELLDRPGLFEDLEAELMGVSWAGMADRQTHVHPYADMESNDSWMPHVIWQQGPTGDYTLNIDDVFQSQRAVAELNAQNQLADKIYLRVSDKHTPVTLDQIKRLLSDGK